MITPKPKTKTQNFFYSSVEHTHHPETGKNKNVLLPCIEFNKWIVRERELKVGREHENETMRTKLKQPSV